MNPYTAIILVITIFLAEHAHYELPKHPPREVSQNFSTEYRYVTNLSGTVIILTEKQLLRRLNLK